MGVPYQKGSCRLEGGLCRPSTLAPGFLHRAHFSALLSFSPSFQTPTHTCTRLPVLPTPPRPRTRHPCTRAPTATHPSICACARRCTQASVHASLHAHSSVHPCTHTLGIHLVIWNLFLESALRQPCAEHWEEGDRIINRYSPEGQISK